ncbi:hypothetical protein FHU41_002488 [Psychromicrobium silvestre]|uniref:Uncharacterized protein n=1 Tax=Psychromicrobium silvestre TaxID=1645614 RepID=A0A7Y9LV90_9MICC|nr:hypothetical protein [Psychromicrobium silvestre]NYE96238.1 hypothetical protein [Psychromicrobium silvestre]
MRAKETLLGIFVVLAITVLTACSSMGGGSAVTSLPRGTIVPVAASDQPIVVDRAGVKKVLAGVRSGLARKPLADSACLDTLAAGLAGPFDQGAVPTTVPSSCGSVQWGWVAGSDPSGVGQAKAAYGSTQTGSSPLLGKDAGHLGFALGPHREDGIITGYVLVWVISP